MNKSGFLLLSCRLGVLAFALLLLIAQRPSRAADEKSAYDPDDFVISYWCGPPARFVTPERIKEIKDANFTVAMGAGGQSYTLEQNRRFLDYCQQNGLKAIVYDHRMPRALGAANKEAIDAIVKDYADHPALLAYYIVDEPGAHAFNALAQVVAYLKEKDPKHPGFINLLPTYAREFNALGAKTYEEYVRGFADKVKPAMISYDHYHFTSKGDRPDFWENLRTVRKVALENKKPFWNIVLVVQHFAYRNLTEAELRFEAMQTLAFGGRGLLWFTYWSPADTDRSAHWEHAMINPDGSRDPHYDMVKRINADVLAIAKELRGAESTAVYEPPAQPTNELITPDDSPIRVTSQQLTVGLFRNGGGKNFSLLASRDYKQPINTRAALRAGGPIERFDAATGTWSPAEEALTLPAGGGVLLRW